MTKEKIDTPIGRDFAKGLARELGMMKWDRSSRASGKARRRRTSDKAWRRARKGHR